MVLHPYAQSWVDHDLDRVLSRLTEDVIFHSPLINEPAFEGRDSVALIFAIALDAFEEPQYTHDFGDENSDVLVADTRVLSTAQDHVAPRVRSQAEVQEIWLMVRPLTGLTALAQAIGQAIEDRAP